MAMMIESIEDASGFEKLREEWTDLLDASASNCLFLTWEWLYTWWTHLSEGRRLLLVTVRSDGQLIAIAPLTLRPPRLIRLVPFRSLEFLGSGIIGSDYLDFIVRAGKEEDACRALADYLRHGKLMLELTQLERRSCLAEQVAAELSGRGWSLSETKTDVCPFIDLSGQSWQSYLATLGSEHRYNFGRRLKNLMKQFEVRFEPAIVALKFQRINHVFVHRLKDTVRRVAIQPGKRGRASSISPRARRISCKPSLPRRSRWAMSAAAASPTTSPA